MKEVVEGKDGTAKKAKIHGIEICGKTGTAQKSINGVYTNKKINSFLFFKIKCLLKSTLHFQTQLIF